MRFERRINPPGWLVVVVPIASIIAALLAGAIVLLATGHDPINTYSRLFERGFFSQSALSSTFRSATPLIFTGLAAAVAFRMRLWNIGGEGQLFLGAVGASGIGLALRGSPGVVVIPAMILAGFVAGALWASIPGILRAYFNTNEIITTLMLNYVGTLLLAYLILDSMSPWRDQSPGNTFPLGARLSAEASWPSFGAGLNLLGVIVVVFVIISGIAAWARRRGAGASWRLWAGTLAGSAAAVSLVGVVASDSSSIIVPLGLILGVAAALVIWVLYRETRFGLEVRVISDSPAAAHYSGMNTKRKIVTVMVLSGGLAGLGGASQVGDFAHLLDPYGLPQSVYGYTGIVVAALAASNAFGAVLAAVLLGGLTNAGFSLRGLDFPLGLVGMLQGLILFFAIGGELFIRHRLRFSRRAAGGDGPGDKSTRPEPEPLAGAAAGGGEQP